VIEESQKNTKTMRRSEANIRFWLLRKGNTDETHTLKPCTNYFSWSPSYRRSIE